ncbi:uncharacterized protein LOC123595637 isoform X3 [Leopardus geoffroyi]|uniref:uncharacterized protein LOC123595637 isoform X3 n=1 Tax=Leopardus geoffroyi TaxID=46844 RepID=UPI001E2656AC|nr:uncharacterized protein LOC123595637 isoform X3 [Leopardus geoffroyi]
MRQDACTNPWWGKRRRCDPEQLEECGNGSRHIPLASQWSVVPPLHLGPRPNSNKIRIKKGRHSSHTVPTEVRSGRSGSPRPGDLCLECAVILLSLFPETHGKTLRPHDDHTQEQAAQQKLDCGTSQRAPYLSLEGSCSDWFLPRVSLRQPLWFHPVQSWIQKNNGLL